MPSAKKADDADRSRLTRHHHLDQQSIHDARTAHEMRAFQKRAIDSIVPQDFDRQETVLQPAVVLERSSTSIGTLRFISVDA
jgi:hypothetical protein